MTDSYYSDQWQVLQEDTQITPTSPVEVKNQYVWGQAYVNELVLRDSNVDNSSSTGNLGKTGSGLEERIYALQDANWNVTTIVDNNDDVLEHFYYDPYGNVTTSDPNGPNSNPFSWNYLFQGGRVDALTGLYTFEHRNYSPVLATWMQEDPAGYVGGANLTRFEDDDPINETDPTGLLGGQGGSGNGNATPPSYPAPNIRMGWGTLHHTQTVLAFRVENKADAVKLRDALWQDVKTWTDFNKSNTGIIRVNLEDGGAQAEFTLEFAWLSASGLLGAIPGRITGENPFPVGLTYTDATHTMQAVTEGEHPLSGIRRWNVNLFNTGRSTCGYTVVLLTEAYEQYHAQLFNANYIAGKLFGGDTAQGETWNNWFGDLEDKHVGDPGVVFAQLTPTNETDLPGKTNPWFPPLPPQPVPPRRITGGHSQCFPADTLVETERGKVAIEVLQEGDNVVSFDFETRHIVSARVTKVITTQRNDLVEIKTPKGMLLVSNNHCFFTSDGELVLARELCKRKVNILVRDGSGKVAVLQALQYRARIAVQPNYIKLYNLQLDQAATYFVGEDGLLVEASD